MSAAHRFAARLASGERLAEPVAIVVAHPDDETLFAGAALARLERLTLVHVTDGAPADMEDATRLGFATRDAYAAARAAELDRAVAALGARPRRLAGGIGDKEAIEQVGALAERLARDLADVAAIVTHPYEGGHPDHDACALACRRATGLIAARTGRAPALVEFASYNEVDGERVFGRFQPDANCPEQVRVLTAEERARIEAAIAAHASQAAAIDGWRPEVERWRAVPDYDFTAPPPPGVCLYDRFGWTLTSSRWRALAAEAAWG